MPAEDENIDDEELEVLVWDWKEKSENLLSSSLEDSPAKLPVVGDGRSYTNTSLQNIVSLKKTKMNSLRA